MSKQNRCPHCGTKIEELTKPEGRVEAELDLTLTDVQAARIRTWAKAHLAAIARDLGHGEEVGDPVGDMGFRPDVDNRDWEFEDLVLEQLRDEFAILAEKVKRG